MTFDGNVEDFSTLGFPTLDGFVTSTASSPRRLRHRDSFVTFFVTSTASSLRTDSSPQDFRISRLFFVSFFIPNASASKSPSFPAGFQDLKNNSRENVRKASEKIHYFGFLHPHIHFFLSFSLKLVRFTYFDCTLYYSFSLTCFFQHKVIRVFHFDLRWCLQS